MGRGTASGECAAERFARGQVPLPEFWRAVERGGQGAADVGAPQVARLIGEHLNGRLSFAQLAAWAGTVSALRCFEVRSARVRSALCRLFVGEPSAGELRGLRTALRAARAGRTP